GGNQPLVHCFGLLTRNDFLTAGAASATAGGGFTFVAGNGDTVTVPGADAEDSGGVYTASPFSPFKLETTTVLGTPMTTMHREPDHDPCFNPDGVFPVSGACA